MLTQLEKSFRFETFVSASLDGLDTKTQLRSTEVHAAGEGWRTKTVLAENAIKSLFEANKELYGV